MCDWAKQREHLCGVRRLWQEESNFGRRGLRSNHAAKLLEPDVRRFVRRDREGLRQFRSQWEISGGVVHQVKWDHRTRGPIDNESREPAHKTRL